MVATDRRAVRRLATRPRDSEQAVVMPYQVIDRSSRSFAGW